MSRRTPTPEKPAVTTRKYHREYKFECEDVDPWAAVPLVQRVLEIVKTQSAGALEYQWDAKCELTLTFESVETASEPQYGHPFSERIDTELMVGHSWQCTEPDEYGEGGPTGKGYGHPIPHETVHRYVIVDADTDRLADVEAIVKEWDTPGALVSVKPQHRDVPVIAVMLDEDTSDADLHDLARWLRAIGAVRVADERRAS